MTMESNPAEQWVIIDG